MSVLCDNYSISGGFRQSCRGSRKVQLLDTNCTNCYNKSAVIRERDMPMDKKQAIEHGNQSATLFFRIRRGYKIYLAFATGILSAFALYREVYHISENKPYSVALAALGGAFITTVMLLIMEIIRKGKSVGTKAGTKLLYKYKEKRSDNGKETENREEGSKISAEPQNQDVCQPDI